MQNPYSPHFFTLPLLSALFGFPLIYIEEDDFQAMSVEVTSETTDILLVTLDDDMVECSEIIKLVFIQRYPPLISIQNYESYSGEYIRHPATVKIIDDDCELFL